MKRLVISIGALGSAFSLGACNHAESVASEAAASSTAKPNPWSSDVPAAPTAAASASVTTGPKANPWSHATAAATEAAK